MEVTQLQFSDTGISFCKKDTTINISYEDILDVTEYSMNKYGNAKLPWSDIFRFHLKTKHQEFIISSLIISRSNLKGFIKKNGILERPTSHLCSRQPTLWFMQKWLNNQTSANYICGIRLCLNILFSAFVLNFK